MEEDNTVTIAIGSDLPRNGAAPNVNAYTGPTESIEPADPVAPGDVDESSLGAGAGTAPVTSSIPASLVSSAGPETSASHDCAANPVVRISGITEIGRDGKTSRITSWKPPFEVEKGYEASFEQIFKRAELVRAPMDAVSVPTGSTPYGTTEESLNRLQKAIAAQSCLSERASRMLAYWTLSTWLPDALPLAPGLAIVGPAYEGDLALRTLRHLCRYPQLLMRADVPSLKNLSWRTTPTLLFFEPNATKQTISFLGCTTKRGYLVGDAGQCKDFYGPKAIYLGEEVSVDRTPRCCVQVDVLPMVPCATEKASRLMDFEVQDLQNQLLEYRLRNLVKVYGSDFDASGLTSDTRAVANALGACVVDSLALQSELISLFTPVESQRQADRSTSLEAVTLEATLNLCHQSKTQILAGEIATEVNRITQARGERLHYSAETIGHRLKKVGLVTRRLGKAGKGLTIDLATMTKVHELAAVYGGVGLDQDENNLHCPLCTEKNDLSR